MAISSSVAMGTQLSVQKTTWVTTVDDSVVSSVVEINQGKTGQMLMPSFFSLTNLNKIFAPSVALSILGTVGSQGRKVK